MSEVSAVSVVSEVSALSEVSVVSAVSEVSARSSHAAVSARAQSRARTYLVIRAELVNCDVTRLPHILLLIRCNTQHSLQQCAALQSDNLQSLESTWGHYGLY